MDTLYLIAEADGAPFAIPAAAVDSVVTRGEIVPIPLAPPHVAGLSALRSRVVTVIDPMAAIRGTAAQLSDDQPLVVVSVDGHSYGLAVDEVHDVIACPERPQPAGTAFERGWQQVALGVVEIDGRAVIVLDPARLIAPGRREAA